jgi:hypothetical protein
LRTAADLADPVAVGDVTRILREMRADERY